MRKEIFEHDRTVIMVVFSTINKPGKIRFTARVERAIEGRETNWSKKTAAIAAIRFTGKRFVAVALATRGPTLDPIFENAQEILRAEETGLSLEMTNPGFNTCLQANAHFHGPTDTGYH